MAVYCVSYDLNKSGKNYEGLYEELKKTAWAHVLGSTWLVSTSESVVQLRDRLRTRMDSDDSIFISKVNRGEYEGWLAQTFWDWLKERV